MSVLSAALETIQPELLAMTRLFGLPDAYWDPPARYGMQAEERPVLFHLRGEHFLLALQFGARLLQLPVDVVKPFLYRCVAR